MEKQKKSSKALLIGIIGAVVILAAVLVLLLTQCSPGPQEPATVPGTTGTVQQDVPSYQLYWNLDREQYAGKSEAGMSSRMQESDGYFHIRMFLDGEEVIVKTADRKIVNKLDTLVICGLEFDEEGLVSKVLEVEEMPLETPGWSFFVQSAGGNTIKLNSSDSFAGMEVLLNGDENTRVYDMTGKSGPVGCEAEPIAYDRVYAFMDLAGNVTHVFLYDRTNFMLTHEGDCQHCGEKVTWSEWTRADAFPNKSGHYQLRTDVQLPGQQSLSNDVKMCLDLNGFTVTGRDNTRMISLHNPGIEFALMDTSEAQTGRLVGHSTASPQGGIVWVRYGQFHMYGGTLDGSDMVSKLNGTVVQVPKNAFFYMYGGEIIGGTAAPQYNEETKKYTYGLGGSVQVTGTMRMYGGTIRGGSAPAAYYYSNGKLTLSRGMGGNIFLSSGSVMEMQGGQILYGHAGNVGANIMMDGTAELIISGGKISGGWTDNKIMGKNGGNVYCSSKSTIEMSGGIIEGGKAYAGGGGNLYLAGTMKMTGGHIFGGIAATSGGNIYTAGNAKLTVYGGTIRNGTANGTTAGNGGGNIHVGGTAPVVKLYGCIIRDGAANGAVNEDGTTSGGDGGNININRGTVFLSGGSVTGGKATGNGGGIYVGWNSVGLELSRKALVYGNAVTDICRSANTASGKSQIILDQWQGNGENGAAVIERLSGVAGSVLAVPKENVTLTQADADKFESNRLVLPVTLSEEGNLILSETASLGEGDHFHCVCGGKLKGTEGHTCSDVGYVSVTAEEFYQCWTENENTYDLAGSLSLCLTEDVTLPTEYKLVGGKLDLCLNGHTVTLEDQGRITSNGISGVLNLSDCGSGSLKAAEGCRTSILYTYKGVMNIYGGTVDASGCAAGTGSAIRVGYADDVLNIYGGTVIGGKKATTGGVIYCNTASTINISGGLVTGGCASGNGGNLYIGHDNCVVNISGGTVSNGFATAAGTGSGLGGNIHVVRGVLNITGGTITGGKANGRPSADEAAGLTGGVYVAYNTKAMNLSGDARLYGNVGSDIYLTSKTSFAVKLGDWEGNGSHGALVLRKLYGAAGSLMVQPASGVTLSKNDVEKFASAHEGLELKLDGKNIVLKDTVVHEHCICAGKLEGHPCETVSFAEVEDTADLLQLFDEERNLIASANVFLTGDVTLDAEYKVNGNTLNLCLNGHTVTMTGDARLTANGSGELNITDCGEGKIMAAEGCRQSFLNTYNGSLNLYAGTIDASAIVLDKKDTGKSGGAVNLNNSADTFHMYGGEIVGATIYRAGGVFAYYGTFYMHGGRISGGNADLGGAVATDRGAFVMDGGVITSCSADTNGAAVFIGYNDTTRFVLSDDAKIYGNTGANDVYAGQKAAADQALILDGWKGNGANGALVIASRDGKAGSVMATAREGTLTAAEVGMLASGHDGLKLVLNADGAIVLEEIIYHQHCVCGGVLAGTEGHLCSELIFTEIATTEEFVALFDNSNTLKADAKVVLMGNIELSAEYKLGGKTLDLCLNDKTLTMSTNGRITANGNGGTLNLVACNGGKIEAAEGARPGLLYTWNGNINIYSGTVNASKCGTGSGGTVTMGNTGDKVNIYGGTFIGNKKSTNGGNFYSSGDGTFTVNGGIITGGVANKTKATGDGLGGNIHMVKGRLNITGGTITGGSANGKANANDIAGISGGIYIPYNAAMTLSGNAKIYGNTGSDIYLTSRTDKAVFTLGTWAGNGSAGALKLAKLEAGDGTQLVAPVSGSLTSADVEKFTSAVEGTGLALDSTGGISLKQLHYHCICSGTVSGNETHTCEKLVYTEVNAAQFLALFGEDKKLTASHNVVLTEDVTLDAEYTMNGNTLNLCLGGSTVTMTSKGRISINGTTGVLNLTACNGGRIEAASGTRVGMLYTYKGELNIFGGTVDATNTAAGEGGAIVMGYAGDKLNIYGGTVTGSQKGTNGGAISCKTDSTICIYGGTVTGGKATTNGGNIYLTAGTLNVSGGTVTGGTGRSGGNIYAEGAAEINISGGSITVGISKGTAAGHGGGNIRIAGTTAMTMTGGTVSGGSATGTTGNDGGNINVNNGTFVFSGGIITGGSAEGNGGGIYVGYNTPGVTIRGSALIYGNAGTDIGRSGNTSTTKGLLILGEWAGNGTNGAAKLDTLLTATGKTVITPASGYTLTEADLAKFECVGTYKLALSGGKFVTAE